ncbi:unnamed protein product [Phytomonas sp. EM1]|nr:unnamed protein product [Phytomonas sp. EM1]|eukprot:CCW59632.1 unnamed protein product [Phytomonas sp. isolate EM1]
MAATALAAGDNAKTAAPNDESLRAFHLLDGESQERLIRIKSTYDNLLPMEKRAFVEMLGLPIDERVIAALFEPRDKTYLHKLYHSNRYDDVRLRDVSYVTLRQGQKPLLEYPPDNTKPTLAAREAIAADVFAVSDSEFRGLLTPALFGEGEVPLQVKKEALYDRLGMLRGDEEDLPPPGEQEEAEEVPTESAKEEEKRSSHPPSQLSSNPYSQRRSTATSNAALPPHAIYRSNGYQTIRLGYSFPVQLNFNRRADGTGEEKGKDDDACVEVINLSGIPIYRNQLREWFDSLGPRPLPKENGEEEEEETGNLDATEHSASQETNKDAYYLDVKTFLEYMRSLDRDFGATATYTQLEKDCVALAKDGDKLGFDAFAYLMMRFVRA